MERYALDLSLKKVEALRALTDAPDWFETIINKNAKKSKPKDVQKGNVLWTHCFCHEERLEVTKRNSVLFELFSIRFQCLGFGMPNALAGNRFLGEDEKKDRNTRRSIQFSADRG